MNNNDLRRYIFTFLRKEPKELCFICKDICVWDKTVKKHVLMNKDIFGFLHANQTYCLECWYKYKIPQCTIN